MYPKAHGKNKWNTRAGAVDDQGKMIGIRERGLCLNKLDTDSIVLMRVTDEFESWQRTGWKLRGLDACVGM